MNTPKKNFIFKLVLLQLVFIVLIISVCLPIITSVKAQETTPTDPIVSAMVALAIGLSVSGPAIGAGIALKNATTAAISAITEKPSTAGLALIFVAMGEALAIYGLIIAILLMQHL
ncbi:MAG: ATP synthase subunit C [Promethearchaeota archaeon]